jgi:hypothetical protein
MPRAARGAAHLRITGVSLGGAFIIERISPARGVRCSVFGESDCPGNRFFVKKNMPRLFRCDWHRKQAALVAWKYERRLFVWPRAAAMVCLANGQSLLRGKWCYAAVGRHGGVTIRFVIIGSSGISGVMLHPTMGNRYGLRDNKINRA